MISTRRKSTVPMYVHTYVCVALRRPHVHHACALDIRYMSLSMSLRVQVQGMQHYKVKIGDQTSTLKIEHQSLNTE